MYYLVYFRPPEKIKQWCANTVLELGSYALKLPGIGSHCTIMTGEFEEDTEAGIVNQIKESLDGKFPVETNNTELFEHNKHKTLVLLLNKTPRLRDFHMGVIENLRPLIDRRNAKPINPEFNCMPNREDTYDRYGSPYFGEFYTPHITIADVKNSFNKKILCPLKASWNVEEIVLAKKEGTWKDVAKFGLD